ncbi:MAG: hypothetical protein GC159_03220 [Phycisphaera sp.]|nr:hypothetical protein [Phycisphaera sp.]
MRIKTILIVAMLGFTSVLHAGEWMFRLRDAHVHLRRALFDRDAASAWEQVDRATRQSAGLLAARIRSNYDGLSDAAKQTLRTQLGVDDDAGARAVQGQDVLVAPFFLEAHRELLVGQRDDAKLKDHGTRMAGPTAIVVQKQTPDEKLVPYTFTVEGHFGGQAMDYRAHLSVPSLDALLGPAPELPKLSTEAMSQQAIAVFIAAQKAYVSGNTEALWPLLDCDSQSQASHFADQAIEQSHKHDDVAELLQISDSELATLDGKHVWALPWAREDLAYFAEGADPRFVDASGYDAKKVAEPNGYKQRGKAPPAESVIEFQSSGRAWQVPVRVNYRSGAAEMKLYLRPPFYLRLRPKK